MKSKWMCATASAVLLLATAQADAQTDVERKQQPGATQQQTAPADTPRSQQQTPPAATTQDRQTSPGSAAEERKQTGQQPGAAGPAAKQTETQKEPAARGAETRDDAAGKAATRKEGGKDEGRAAESAPSDTKGKDATQARDRDRDDDRRATDRQPDQKTTRDADRQDRAGDTAKETGDRIQVTERERTTIQQSIDVERARVDIDIDVNIGARVPRNVTLYPLPATIIDINPRWRSYRYVVVRNEIVIINPETFVIVEVIPVSGRTRARVSGVARASVQLSGPQRQRVLAYARAECQTVLTEPGFEIGVGVRIPERIELCPFEDVIVREVDVVQPYRFFVVQNQVVLVDPSTHTIIEVLR